MELEYHNPVDFNDTTKLPANECDEVPAKFESELKILRCRASKDLLTFAGDMMRRREYCNNARAMVECVRFDARKKSKKKHLDCYINSMTNSPAIIKNMMCKVNASEDEAPYVKSLKVSVQKYEKAFEYLQAANALYSQVVMGSRR